MGENNKGKAFEDRFRKDWRRCFPGTFVFRLKDQMTGYKETSGNPCDFLCFPGNSKLFMVECKEHKGASIPFTAIPQYERLLEYKDFPGVYPGVVVWFSEKDIVIWVGIHDMEKMVNDGEKSIGIRMLDNKSYNIMVLPSEKQRVFMETDYTYLADNVNKEEN